MFSKSKRFIQPASSTPAVGQYDVTQKPSEIQGCAISFPKDKRFKEKATNENDTSLLDISNCSTLSAKSSSSGAFDRLVFATPGKPCEKGRKGSASASNGICQKTKSCQTLASDKAHGNLIAKISRLQEEIEQLKSESASMEKGVAIHESSEALNSRITALMEDVDRLMNENKVLNTKLTELESAAEERHSLESHLSKLNKELEKLRSEIEKEILRNKELVIEQSKYECSIETVKTDLDFANRNVTVLQEQINSLEQLNTELSESRDDMENQCSKLHGMTLGLQELNITLQVRLEEVEENYKTVATGRENAETQLLSQTEEYKRRVHKLECALTEKMSAMMELNEEKASLKDRITVYETKLDNIKTKLDEALKAQKTTHDEMKILQEQRDASLLSVQELKEKQENITNHSEEKIAELKEEMHRNDEHSLQNLRSLTEKCQMLEDQLACLQQERTCEVRSLQKELELNQTSLQRNQEEYKALSQAFREIKKDYDMERTNRIQLESDFSHVKTTLETTEFDLKEAKEHIAKLEDEGEEHKEAANVLSAKLHECNNTIQSLEKKNLENEDVVCENKRVKNEIEKLEVRLLEVCEEKKKATVLKTIKEEIEQDKICLRDIFAAEEKATKLKQEFGRRLVETQKKLSQKDIELESCKKEFADHFSNCNGQESWKLKYEELLERISPFQEQLDAYEFEKQSLLSRNTESQSEIDKLSQQYAKLLGHQNQKQKIRHVLKLKEENTNLKKEVAKLREQSIKQKQSIKKLEVNMNKGTGQRRFDPSLAFQHNKTSENKENTPLKTLTK